jgi:hypothetical protein
VQQPGPLKILSGTRLQELASQLQVLPEADMKALSKRKSFLYDGDLVEVPAKKTKKQTSKKETTKERKKEDKFPNES